MAQNITGTSRRAYLTALAGVSIPLAGCFGDSEDESEQSDESSEQEQQSEQDQQSQDSGSSTSGAPPVEIRIDCITDWSASLSTEDASVTVQGPGIETATIDGYPQQVSVVAQKQDDSYEPLTVEIYVDGTLVSEQTTTAEYGVVRLTVQP